MLQELKIFTWVFRVRKKPKSPQLAEYPDMSLHETFEAMGHNVEIFKNSRGLAVWRIDGGELSSYIHNSPQEATDHVMVILDLRSCF